MSWTTHRKMFLMITFLGRHKPIQNASRKNISICIQYKPFRGDNQRRVRMELFKEFVVLYLVSSLYLLDLLKVLNRKLFHHLSISIIFPAAHNIISPHQIVELHFFTRLAFCIIYCHQTQKARKKLEGKFGVKCNFVGFETS